MYHNCVIFKMIYEKVCHLLTGLFVPTKIFSWTSKTPTAHSNWALVAVRLQWTEARFCRSFIKYVHMQHICLKKMEDDNVSFLDALYLYFSIEESLVIIKLFKQFYFKIIKVLNLRKQMQSVIYQWRLL